MHRNIVLRRFEGEPLEIVALNVPAAGTSREWPLGCVVQAWVEDGMTVYNVGLPDGYAVRPVDWRRFVPDETKTHELIERCIRDNAAESLVEPWTPELRTRVEARLALAFGDLVSLVHVSRTSFEADRAASDRKVSIEVRDALRRVFTLIIALPEP